MKSEKKVGISLGNLICPVCGSLLEEQEHSYVCPKRHNYDKAKSGYVNLLLSNGKNSKLPGDNKLMVAARKNFLEKGYYQILSDALCKEVTALAPENPVILDAGCGEGYYTGNVWEALHEAGKNPCITGIDISKFALNSAAKQKKPVSYAVASVFHLPVMENSCHMVLNLFAPYCGEEFERVLEPGGFLFLIIPGEDHLWELKQAVYDEPYKNQVKDYALEGFRFQKAVKVANTITLESNEDIKNLFTMTPYYYKTSAENTARLDNLEQLTTTIQFEILIYQCEK
ncbi:MAG: putative RNA methyltransferase [Massiliimalia sp.]|jgi:23S rRNA (guanine745-N1)-methyltransferase